MKSSYEPLFSIDGRTLKVCQWDRNRGTQYRRHPELERRFETLVSKYDAENSLKRNRSPRGGFNRSSGIHRLSKRKRYHDDRRRFDTASDYSDVSPTHSLDRSRECRKREESEDDPEMRVMTTQDRGRAQRGQDERESNMETSRRLDNDPEDF